MSFAGRSIISINDLSKEDILHVLDVARKIETEKPRLLTGKVLATLFFEASTRTRLSFESAMQRAGGSVISVADKNTSSDSKGESLSDTAKIVAGYADIIVIRHSLDGAARLAAKSAGIPVINAGDGSNQHPTQTLLDLYTIMKTHGTLEGLHVTMVGDLRYGRTVHSLALALSHFGCTLSFVAPELLRMPSDLLNTLKERGVAYTESDNIHDVLPSADIVYMTRVQRERFPDPEEYEKVKNVYVLRRNDLRLAKPSMKILHPLPRVGEINPDVDSTPHACYFSQAKNGVPVRQAILCLCLGVAV